MQKATEAQLESLANACAPATFGAGNKDVLDLSYRKAGKMDVINFVTRFDPDRLGLSEFVRGQLKNRLSVTSRSTAMSNMMYPSLSLATVSP